MINIGTAYELASIILIGLIAFFTERSVHGYFLKTISNYKKIMSVYKTIIKKWNHIYVKNGITVDRVNKLRIDSFENNIDILLNNIKRSDKSYHFWAAFNSVFISVVIATLFLFSTGEAIINGIAIVIVLLSIRWLLDIWMNKVAGYPLTTRGKDNPMDIPFKYRWIALIVGLAIYLINGYFNIITYTF